MFTIKLHADCMQSFKGKQQKQVRQLQCTDHIPYLLSGCRVHISSELLSKQLYALDTQLVMPGHYKKTANQSPRIIEAILHGGDGQTSAVRTEGNVITKISRIYLWCSAIIDTSCEMSSNGAPRKVLKNYVQTVAITLFWLWIKLGTWNISKPSVRKKL